ncbi:MAG: hypothetical protein A2Z07_11315 [Armatimonadetes bacterium RBG_16_67_12]|nr:MAG: hypothetical protein A2Z07_11315 [Armatimonadetes bacterium RBG_16_67_12]
MLEDLRRQVVETVSPLSDEQINQTVPGLRNTIGILLKHIAGAERYWIGEVAGGRAAQRNRDAEFEPAPVRKDEALAETERVAALSSEVLDRLTRDDLLVEVEAQRPRGMVRETKAGALLLATQHVSYHLGQIRYLARLLQGPRER